MASVPDQIFAKADSASVDAMSPIVAHTCTPRIQELIILPTEKCNFRCTYCYEDFSIGKMSEATQKSIERFLEARTPELSRLDLSWFGGEPLAAKDVVRRLSSYAHRLCELHGVELNGGLTTNAWHLDYDLFEELVGWRQNFFQITLDGWGEFHDLYRRRANGGGTFDRVWANLLSYRQSKQDFSVQLRLHVRRGRDDELEKLLAQIACNFGGDKRFRLDFEHIRDLGGEGGKTVSDPLNHRELKEIEARMRVFYEEAVHESNGGSALPELSHAGPSPDVTARGGDEFPYVCYASRPNSLLIRADGRIGKCTVALTDDRNTIGVINEDGSVSIDSAKLRPWIRGIISLDERELGCPLVGLGQANVMAQA